jgi:preprotein translocase subunit SecD
VVFQVAGDNYIVGEFPGLENIDEVVSVIKQTGMLEFVDVGQDLIEPGTIIQTDYNGSGAAVPSTEADNTEAESDAASAPATASETPAEDKAESTANKVYHTVITGADLDSVVVTAPTTSLDGYAVSFKLKSDATKKFGEFTKANVGNMLAIVLDKKIGH